MSAVQQLQPTNIFVPPAQSVDQETVIFHPNANVSNGDFSVSEPKESVQLPQAPNASQAALARLMESNLEFILAAGGSITGSKGTYKLIGKLGQGGMGTVYLGEDESGKKVAIKSTNAGGDLDRFQDEIRIMKELSRPGNDNVMAYMDDGNLNGNPFLVAEHIEGETLESLIKKGEISIGDALGVVAEVCKGIQYVHDKGYVVRDIKASNIMVIKSKILNSKVVPHPAAKLIDVAGLAKREFDSRNHGYITRNTMTGRAAGTLVNMAPEQATSQTTKDYLLPATDIWQIGCLISSLFIGGSPFTGKNETQTFINITDPTKVPKRLDRIPFAMIEVPPHIAQIVSFCFKRNPSDRELTAGGIAGLILNTLAVKAKDLDKVERDDLRERFRHSKENAELLFRTPCARIPHLELQTGTILRTVVKIPPAA